MELVIEAAATLQNVLDVHNFLLGFLGIDFCADAHIASRRVDITRASLVTAGAAAHIRKAFATCGRESETRDRENGRATQRHLYLDVLWTGSVCGYGSYVQLHPCRGDSNHHSRCRSLRFYGLEIDTFDQPAT